jgi:homoserine dehydrogenase
MRSQLNVALLGCGNVGSGVVEVLASNGETIAQRAGLPIEIVGIAVRDPNKPRSLSVDRRLLTTDAAGLVRREEVDCVVECIGGLEPAYDLVMSALEQGKSVVTANKELIAKRGKDLFEAADQMEVDLLFEGSVAGGIPVVHALKESLAGNQVTEMLGILNGTTNYVLTRMSERGESLESALGEAQRLRYAEKDPTDDISGTDAAYKLAILASIAFSSRMAVEDIFKEGIEAITPADLRYAAEQGYVVKLLAIARAAEGGEIELRVHPALVPQRHPIAAVKGHYNAVFVRGNAVGEVMLYGQGAGSLPTGSAVVGDIISVARNFRSGARGRVACTCHDQRKVLDMAKIETRYYVRMGVKDRPGVLGATATVFGKHRVSIASVVQKRSAMDVAEIVWVTHLVQEANVRGALEELRGLPVVQEIGAVIRVEEEE